MKKVDLVKNLNVVRERIATSCHESGRKHSQVRLIAVSKGQDSAKIQELVSLGITCFGENYLDELTKKAFDLKCYQINWVFIGTLQSNKIKRIVKITSEIQTVASLKHAQFINRYAKEFNKMPYPVYISVNAGKEPTKSGVFMENVASLAKQIAPLTSLSLKGIMTIPPKSLAMTRNAKTSSDFYRRLKELSQSVGQGHLSLGMSADLEKAITVGATTLRVGRALFGERK